MAIELSNRQRLVPIGKAEITKAAEGTLAAAGPTVEQPGELVVVVAFVRDPAIRKLNSTYRGLDKATDVLSFPSGQEYNPDSDVYLGDIVISTDAVVRQAKLAGHSNEHEISELVIHGVLHLCGYDHETDQGQMNRLEMMLRRALLNSPKRSRSSKNGY